MLVNVCCVLIQDTDYVTMHYALPSLKRRGWVDYWKNVNDLLYQYNNIAAQIF